MYCIKCGAQISGSEKYCPQCGNEMKAIMRSIEISEQKEDRKKIIKRHRSKSIIIGVFVFALFICIGCVFFQFTQRKMIGTWINERANHTLEFYKDHTYVEYDGMGKYPYKSGTWRVLGNKLIMHVDGKDDKYEYNLTVDGRKMEIEYWSYTREEYLTRSFTKVE